MISHYLLTAAKHPFARPEELPLLAVCSRAMRGATRREFEAVRPPRKPARIV